ncbi:MAG: DEAD/DEAH box helicase family protein [Candidatus Portiera sp.]|nr:DEAD/DEAH box helicase family protein [Portiera sp.]
MTILFERQPYQEDCVNNIIDILKASDWQNDASSIGTALKEIYEAHPSLLSYTDKIREELRLDISMETGTGKTFTYLKTMYELHESDYKIKKFLIFVPRLAIRAGIVQNIDMTRDYFKKQYGTSIRKYIYDGKKKGLSQVIRYITNKDEFSVLILTSSSISGNGANGENGENSDSGENDKNGKSKGRILTRVNEELFDGSTPLEGINKLKPVIFIDEPHLLTGDKFVAAYEKHFPQCLQIRFGATFPEEDHSELSNVAYCLDSVTAFNDHLVKRIKVSTIKDEMSAIKLYRSPPKSATPLTLTYFKNGEENKADLKYDQNISTITGDKEHDFNVIRISGNEAVLSNRTRRVLSSGTYTLPEDTIRSMIRETIELHFEKEEALFKQGIKTLSLFFIPNVFDYRGESPRIKNIFEEEYKLQRVKKLKEKLYPTYKKYLQQDYDAVGNLKVNEGYFSGDGKTKEEKDNAGIELILNKKEELLSTKTSLRFIFSVWALQEGWDNPNIFNLCKLASTDKKIKIRQQVGRGLRLAVNQNGKRQTIEYHEDNEGSFYAINTLDVVVSAYENNYIQNIQEEIVGTYISTKFISYDVFRGLGLNLVEASQFVSFLVANDAVIPDSHNNEILQIKYPISSLLEEKKNEFPIKLIDKYDQLLSAFKFADKKRISNRESKVDKVPIRTEKFKEFDALWKAITKKAIMVYGKFDESKVIKQISEDFDKEPLDIDRKTVLVQVYNSQENRIDSHEKPIAEITPFTTHSYEEFVMDFSDRIRLPLSFCRKMFNSLDKTKLWRNPRRATKLLESIVKEKINSNSIKWITYKFAEATPAKTRQIFYQDVDYKIPLKEINASSVGTEMEEDNLVPRQEYLYDKIAYDSRIELDIIKNDAFPSDKKEVVVFAKLPKLSIPTPYSSYNPDFAYLIKREVGNKGLNNRGGGNKGLKNNRGDKAKKIKDQLYLIVESKGYDKLSAISESESTKIKYGKEFFKALDAMNKNAEQAKIVYTSRINKQNLTDLIETLEAEE